MSDNESIRTQEFSPELPSYLKIRTVPDYKVLKEKSQNTRTWNFPMGGIYLDYSGREILKSKLKKLEEDDEEEIIVIELRGKRAEMPNAEDNTHLLTCDSSNIFYWLDSNLLRNATILQIVLFF